MARLEKSTGMNLITIHENQISETLRELQSAGRQHCERVVLWLGVRSGEEIEIREVFVPEQYAERDFFRIPREAMLALMKHLRKTRYLIAAQVHSHPTLAFHSMADDRWAIVRHEGALSLVLPHFGLNTSEHAFVKDAAVFRLSPANEWVKILPNAVSDFYLVIP